MNQRICSIALVGGLVLLFCIPLSAKTLYVADNGDNTNGLSWETAYTTIHSAVSAAQAGSVTDPNLVTIIVGSAETGHGSGTYLENIDISLAGLTLTSENGFESTIIQAASAGDHAINITGDYVTVRGFSIYGAATGGLTQYSGIALNGADNCLIENNRCGWSSTTYQNANGMSLSSANNNTVRNNLCTWNTNSGIYLASSQNNVITQNVFSQNGNYGIEMASGSNYNSVTLNYIQNNTNDAFYLNSANWNQIVSNLASGNRYGVNGVYPEHNSWYLNDFSRNNSSSFYLKYSPVSSGDFWVSPTPLCYGYSNSIHLNSMGNLYKEYAGADSDQNGIGDTAHPIKDGVVDPAPLTDPNLSYAVQAWYLGDPGAMTMDPNQPGIWQPLASGSSYVWLSNTPAKEEITFAALDVDDGWNGQVRFKSTTANNFEIEVGFVDPNDGIFVGSGATAALSGNYGLLTFETAGQTFSVQAGKLLAVQITNNGAEKQLYLGGAWSYITAPAGTDIPWPGTQEVPPEPPVNPGDLDGDGWVNMEDAAYLSLHWGLTDCTELNNYCQRADIDKSSDVGPGDLYLLATYWLMEPDELLAGDWNEDFKVNMDDAALLSSQWGGDLNQLVELCDNWLKGVF